MTANQFSEDTWLEWLVKVRIIIITFLLGIGLVITRLTSNNIDESLFISVIVLWYTIAVFFVLLHALWKEWRLQSSIQVFTDLAFSTAIIYVSGGIDTSFNFLYPLVIIVASILLPRWWAYLTAGISFIAFGAILELSYFGVVRSYSVTNPELKSLQAIILINLFAYVAIAYLASTLSQKLRLVDVQLQDKSGALQSLQAMHENVIHSMRGGLITTDLEGRITLLNVPGQRLLGRSARQVFGNRVDELFLDPLPSMDSFAVTCEVRSLAPSGEERTFGMTVTPLRMPDLEVAGYVYTFTDLTEMKRLEREVRMRDRLTAVGRMAAGIAHEIRNPLASIAGSVQVLAGISALSEEQRTLVNIVTRESERLNHIISDFLVYSREKKLQFAAVDLISLLDDTFALLENHPRQEQSGVKIVRQYGMKEAIAWVDADKMKQVFWNLCENAMRAMPNGGELSACVREKGDDLEVVIADSGVGIPAHQLEKIFEPFQSSFSGGTGLGLAIVYQVIQAHEGSISVSSQSDKGTEFVLRLKRCQRDATLSPLQLAHAQGGARG